MEKKDHQISKTQSKKRNNYFLSGNIENENTIEI